MMDRPEIPNRARQRWWNARQVHGLVLASGLISALVSGPAAASEMSNIAASGIVHEVEDDGSARPISPEEMTACLLGVWMHSIEEDTQELTIYRPGDYAFPPARGRTGFEFITAGYLVYHGFGPADEPEVTNGRWELISPNLVTIEVNQEQGPSPRETLEIVACSDDLLQIAR